MKYQASFVGRQNGAIGICYPITTEVEGDTEQDATLRLYGKYEHISKLKLTPVPQETVKRLNES